VYHTYEGKLNDLLKRFREHTTKLFEKHGMKNVAYWTPLDEPAKSTTLIYTSRIPAAKPQPPTGKLSKTIRNGRACAKSPKRTEKSWRKWNPRSWS
jgi:hypothetical protein